LKVVFYTFFNSKLDIDYSINTKSFHKLIIFYCYKPPKNILKNSNNVSLVNTNIFEELNNNDDFFISRAIKFNPWKYIKTSFDNFVYFDYRIRISKKFIDLTPNLNGLYFFKHREGGNLKNEIFRLIVRNKISLDHLIYFLSNFKNFNNLPLTENGVFVVNKKLIKSHSKMTLFFKKINRDQILTPIFHKDEKINFFKFRLDNILYFHVRPKKLTLLNYLKLFVRGFLFNIIRYWKK
tara:strand:- start:9763 stop:10473 length:711 start_codon:yes stop_codon:yes gene_type:complete